MKSAARLLWVIGAIALSVVLFIVTIMTLRFQFGVDFPFAKLVRPESLAFWGQIGDFFGGILNPLLSFTALLAVLYNIKMQSEELNHSREETRNSNIIQRRQEKIFERQLFETTFFGLLKAQAEILQQVKLRHRSNSVSGQGAFEQVYLELFENHADAQGTIDFRDLAHLEEICDSYTAHYQAAFGQYFRNLYHILKLVDSTDALKSIVAEANFPIRDAESRKRITNRRFLLDYLDRRQYSNFLRAQLSNQEVALMFINCLSMQGVGLKPYVEKYSMLKSMRRIGDNDVIAEVCARFDVLAYSDSEAIEVNELLRHSEKMRRDRFVTTKRIVKQTSSL